MPEITELRNNVVELEGYITEWSDQIENLQSQITNAQSQISNLNAEIERLEAEEHRGELITQLTEALTSMSNEQLVGLISSLQNGETSIPAPENRAGRTVLVINNDEESEYEITEEMKNSFCTIVGTSHHPMWNDHHYTPTIGQRVTLSKDTPTGNCWAIIDDVPDDYHPDAPRELIIGVLPTEGSDKTTELAELNLPCKVHQWMWGRDDLNETYIVTGAVPGKYVTLKKSDAPATPEPVEQPVEEPELEEYHMENPETTYSIPSGMSFRVAEQCVDTETEARTVFNNTMRDTCTITAVLETPNAFVIHYDNHECNSMPEMKQAFIVKKND